ncbi:hypothetical protein FBALC1_03182 [Flavobacteriales bacterium ALC-1]|nr:hypothetical protein FBALC1_03182 [Flavobacteriales bacterium ALC-1]
MKKIKRVVKRTMFPKDKFQKVYTGNVFDRFIGLENILAECKGLSILDIGAAEGLIDYEFAKNGCSLIHGFERDPKRVNFAKLLFQEVPIESQFRKADLSIKFEKFNNKFKDILLDNYDITLYLGVYHHLIKQSKEEDVHEFIKCLLRKTKTYFVVRTNMIESIENIILEENFVVHYVAPPVKVVGQLKVYKRA